MNDIALAVLLTYEGIRCGYELSSNKGRSDDGRLATSILALVLISVVWLSVP